MVHYYENCVEALAGRQASDKVHGDFFPRTVWYWERPEVAEGGVADWFDLTAGAAVA